MKNFIKSVFKSKVSYLVIFALIVAMVVVLFILVLNVNNSKRFSLHYYSNNAFLPDTTDGIHLGLPFYRKSPSKIAGKGVDVIWGPYNPIYPGVVMLGYEPFDRAPSPAASSSPDILQNHPDWIVYQPDQTTPASEFGGHAYALDISNPAVIDYELRLVESKLSAGFAGVIWDNVMLDNEYDECGIWKSPGNFAQLWGPPGGCPKKLSSLDPAREATVLAWAKETYSRIKAFDPKAIVAMNYQQGTDVPNGMALLDPYFDIDINERGVTNWGSSKTGGYWLKFVDWQSQMNSFKELNAKGKGLIMNAEVEAATNTAVTQTQINWALSNYLLAKGAHTYTYISTVDSSGNATGYLDFYDRPEYHIAIGHPTNDYYQSQGVYMRDYSNGLTIVNPSDTATITVTLSKPYVDMYGNSVTSFSFAPHTGLVLLNPE